MLGELHTPGQVSLKEGTHAAVRKPTMQIDELQRTEILMLYCTEVILLCHSQFLECKNAI